MTEPIDRQDVQLPPRNMPHVRAAARAGKPFPMPDTPRGTRVVANVTLHEVEGGRFQARCTCRWWGRRMNFRGAAILESDLHARYCGLCQRIGRHRMDVCSCWPCQKRRAARRDTPPAEA